MVPNSEVLRSKYRPLSTLKIGMSRLWLLEKSPRRSRVACEALARSDLPSLSRSRS
ncbi:hypothetical protein D3C79_1102330 [compost metagenome]